MVELEGIVMSGDEQGATPQQCFVLRPVDLSGAAADGVRAELLRAAQDPSTTRIQVDCRDVERIDNSVLSVLVAAAQVARARSVPLEVIHPNSLTVRVLHESGLSKVVSVVTDPFPPRPWSDLQ